MDYSGYLPYIGLQSLPSHPTTKVINNVNLNLVVCVAILKDGDLRIPSKYILIDLMFSY